MKTNSKNKGSRFERVVAKAFEKWTGYKFSRTPGSGGWAKAKDSFGDIVCTDSVHSKRFPFSIECKSYKEIKFEHILLGNKGCKILEFWEQAKRDAKIINKVPLLIMRYNSMPSGEAFCIMEKTILDSILANQGLHILGKPIMYLDMPNWEYLAVVMFSDILTLSYREDVYKVVRKLEKL